MSLTRHAVFAAFIVAIATSYGSGSVLEPGVKIPNVEVKEGTPELVDWDNDGDLDLLTSAERVSYVRLSGSKGPATQFDFSAGHADSVSMPWY